MRDIRDDLRQRISALREEKDQLQAQLAEIDTYEEQLSALLVMEEKRAGGGPRDGTGADTTGQSASQETQPELEKAVLKLLRDGEDWQHEKLKAALEGQGWEMKKGSFGRFLHGLLMSMRNRDLVELVGTGVWRKVRKGTAAAA